jgi:hypothetical protein
MFTKNIFTQKDSIADLVKPMLEAQTKTKMEELKGNQAVLDKNKNNKLDADDFKILRGEKKAVKEENVEESSPFDWKKPREPEVKGGAGIKKGRAYGGAAQKSKPEQDDADDKKKTQKEEVESKEKEEKDDVPFDGPYKKKDSAKAGKHGAGYSTARQLAQMGMKKALKKEEVEQVEERTLTKGETAEKERIVKGMKKSLAGFKARYGEKAKSVMYATATKAAKKD